MGSRESDQREKWIKKYYWFLVEKYGFRYDGYVEGRSDFSSEKVIVQIEPSYKTPYIFIYRVGEPDHTKLILERIIQYFDGDVPNFDFQKHSLKRNLKVTAIDFIKRADKIITGIDDWWIPVQVYQYEMMRQVYVEKDQLDDFLIGFKEDHNYLKSKSAI